MVKGELRGGVRYFDETEREIIAAVAELARYGVGGRNLRVFRSSADREANLLAADPRSGAALAQPGAAQGGGRRAREPRRGGHPPQAPAADQGPAQDRPVSGPGTSDLAELRALIRDIPDFPTEGILFKDLVAAAGGRRRHCARPCEGSPISPGRCGSTAWSPPRRAASCSARRWRSSSAPASCSRASPASSRTRPSAPSTCSSTAPGSSSSTATRSAEASGCSSTTTCSPRAAPPRALCELVERLGGEVAGCSFLIELAFLRGRERLAPREVHALLAVRRA